MRLTSKQKIELKNGKATDYYGYKYEQAYQIIQKLGQLEDIEDELGIDLIIFLKAILNVLVYVKDKNKIEKCCIALDKGYDGKLYFCSDKCTYYVKDYGKTWALTKEELI